MNGQRLRKHNREEVPPAGIEPRERRLGGEFFAASLRHFHAAGDPRRRAAFALQFGGKIRQSSAALRREKIAEIGPPPSPTPIPLSDCPRRDGRESKFLAEGYNSGGADCL